MIRFNKIPGLSSQVVVVADKAVRAVAFALLEQATQNIQEVGAVDTGALLGGGYVATSTKSDRDAAVAKSVSKSSSGSKNGKNRKPKVSMAIPSGNPAKLGEAKVAFAPEHAVYVEMGVDNAFGQGIQIPARPFLHPAVAEIEGRAEQIAGEVVRDSLQ